MEKSNPRKKHIGKIILIILLIVFLAFAGTMVYNIFKKNGPPINPLDPEIKKELNESLNENKTLAIHPSSKSVKIEKGQTPPEGFVFAIYNPNNKTHTYTYETEIILKQCEGLIEKEQIENWMLGGNYEEGITLGPNKKMIGKKIAFIIPENAPECAFVTNLKIEDDEGYSSNEQILVNITSKRGIF